MAGSHMTGWRLSPGHRILLAILVGVVAVVSGLPATIVLTGGWLGELLLRREPEFRLRGPWLRTAKSLAVISVFYGTTVFITFAAGSWAVAAWHDVTQDDSSDAARIRLVAPTPEHSAKKAPASESTSREPSAVISTPGPLLQGPLAAAYRATVRVQCASCGDLYLVVVDPPQGFGSPAPFRLLPQGGSSFYAELAFGSEEPGDDGLNYTFCLVKVNESLWADVSNYWEEAERRREWPGLPVLKGQGERVVCEAIIHEPSNLPDRAK